jgi:MoaA/NifB/PqqE/SkfB family radical SAM enzyme
MSKKLSGFTKRIRIIYKQKGLGGLYSACTEKAMRPALPMLYKNKVLTGIHHPKLKIAYLDITNKCNLRCAMCNFQQLQKEFGYMPKDAFENYVDQLADMGLDTLFLHCRGESLLHPDFKDFLKYAIQKRNQTRKIGKVVLVTNGMLFDQRLADLVVDLKVDTIIFSLDGVGQVNDNIRVGSKYSVIEQNIKYLLKRRGTAKKPFVELNVVDYGKTGEQKTEIYREWVQLVDQITLIGHIQPDNSVRNNRTTTEKNMPKFCYFPFVEIAISWDGKVTGCVLDYEFKMATGDATKTPINQIWRGSNFQASRKAAVTNTFPADSPCVGCDFWRVHYEPKTELILDGKAKIIYGEVARSPYTHIRKA